MDETNKVELQPETEEITRGALPTESEKEVVDKKEEFKFVTTQPVSFNINGKLFEGTEFSFETKELAEDRKQMLIRSYGEGIIG
jgi:hypothetical protein